MRCFSGLLLVLLTSPSLFAQAWDRTHTREDLARFLQQAFPGQDAVPMGQAYRGVQAKGWLPTVMTRKLLKQQLRDLVRDSRSRGRSIDLKPGTVFPDPRGRPASAVAAEIEYNDSEAYATDLGVLIAPLSATGSMSSADDKDALRFETLIDGVVTFKMTYTGTKPDLVITGAAGQENWGYHYYDSDTVVLHLPSGVYHANLASFDSSTTYSLALTFQPQSIPTLALGATTGHTFGPDPKLLKVVLPQDGRFGLSMTANGAGDSLLILQNSKWGFIYDVDDTGAATNGEAGLDIQLPKGTYYLYVWSDLVVTESFTTTFASQATPVLSNSATGTLATSPEVLDLFQIVVTTPEFLDLRITGNGSSAIADPYLILYDQNMTQILEGDDDPASTFSVIGATLPTGVYYVASTSYYDYGGYQISKASAMMVTQVAQAGVNVATVPSYSSVGFRLKLATASRLEVDLDEGSLDGQVGVLDWKTGLAVSWEDDDFYGPQYCHLGMQLPAGEYLFLVKDYSGDTGSVDLQLLPPLQRWQGDNVMVRGHSGDLLFFVVGTKESAPNNPLPGFVSGNLLVDLSTAVILPLVMPAGGIIDFQTSLPPRSGVFLQMVTVDSVSGSGAYSNLLK